MPRWHAMRDADELSRAASSWILHAATASIRRSGRFRVVVSGGRTPRETHRALAGAGSDWAHWEVWFADERCLDQGDPGLNSSTIARDWLDHVAIPASQIHAIPTGNGAKRAAEEYSDLLRGIGDFDLVLLGLGEDGHTASLFPGRDWGTAPDAPGAIPVFDAPKSPRERVSMTASRLSRTRELLFLVAGGEKRDAVVRWLAGEALPAAAIAPPSGADVLVAV